MENCETNGPAFNSNLSPLNDNTCSRIDTRVSANSNAPLQFDKGIPRSDNVIPLNGNSIPDNDNRIPLNDNGQPVLAAIVPVTVALTPCFTAQGIFCKPL